MYEMLCEENVLSQYLQILNFTANFCLHVYREYFCANKTIDVYLFSDDSSPKYRVLLKNMEWTLTHVLSIVKDNPETITELGSASLDEAIHIQEHKTTSGIAVETRHGAGSVFSC